MNKPVFPEKIVVPEYAKDHVKKREKKGRSAAMYRPKEGYVENPLRTGKYRNMKCICGSEIKVKKCCGRKLYLEKDYAEAIMAEANKIKGEDHV